MAEPVVKGDASSASVDRKSTRRKDAGEEEIVLAIPPTDSIEEFLLYPQSSLVLTQYLLSTKQKDDLLLFWNACKDFKRDAPTMTPDVRREQGARIFAGFLKVWPPPPPAR